MKTQQVEEVGQRGSGTLKVRLSISPLSSTDKQLCAGAIFFSGMVWIVLN